VETPTKKSSIIDASSSSQIQSSTSSRTNGEMLFAETKATIDFNFTIWYYSTLSLFAFCSWLYLKGVLSSSEIENYSTQYSTSVKSKLSVLQQIRCSSLSGVVTNVATLYPMILKMTHPALKIYYLSSTSQNVTMKLNLSYLRLLTHLSVSTFLIQVFNQDSSSSWMFNFMKISLVVLFAFFFMELIIVRLFNTSKYSTGVEKTIKPDFGISKTEEDVNIFSENSYSKPRNSRPKVEKVATEVSHSRPAKRVITSVLLMIFTMACTYILVNHTTESFKSSSPFGLWYLAALAFDLAIFLPVVSLLKLAFLLFFLRQTSQRNQVLAKTVLGNDLIDVATTSPLK
jgi:hypothetical protein